MGLNNVNNIDNNYRFIRSDISSEERILEFDNVKYRFFGTKFDNLDYIELAKSNISNKPLGGDIQMTFDKNKNKYYLYSIGKHGVISTIAPEKLNDIIAKIPDGVEGFDYLFERDNKEIFDAIAVAYLDKNYISDESVEKIKRIISEGLYEKYEFEIDPLKRLSFRSELVDDKDNVVNVGLKMVIGEEENGTLHNYTPLEHKGPDDILSNYELSDIKKTFISRVSKIFKK